MRGMDPLDFVRDRVHVERRDVKREHAQVRCEIFRRAVRPPYYAVSRQPLLGCWRRTSFSLLLLRRPFPSLGGGGGWLWGRALNFEQQSYLAARVVVHSSLVLNPFFWAHRTGLNAGEPGPK